MTIRTELHEEESIAISEPIYAMFLGDCFGVVLTKRGPEDPHVCFTIVVEDDGTWAERSRSSFYWMNDLQDVLKASMKFVKKFCIKKDKFEHQFTQDQLARPIRVNEK
jgi:hypothetical protein